MSKSVKIQVGRSAKTGKFTTVAYANKHKSTTIVETIKLPKK